jgi:hypothetical protein
MHIFSPKTTLISVYASTFLDIEEKILNYLLQVERGGFDLKL